jgi:hypothetical protein
MARKTRTTLALALSLSLTASAVFSHGDMKHVLGTVREIAADHIVVDTKNGGKESIAIDGSTQYFRGDAPVKPGELKVGDRVVIHATPSNPSTAKTIRFSSPAAAK